MKLNMEIIVAAVMILSMSTIAAGQIVRNIRLKTPVEMKAKVFPVVLAVSAVLLAVDAACSGGCLTFNSLAVDMMSSAVSAWILSSSILEDNMVKWITGAMFILNLVLIAFHICGNPCMPVSAVYDESVLFVSLLAVSLLLLILYCLWLRLRSVKQMMKNAGVWSMVCIIVDFVYLGFVITAVALLQLGLSLAGFVILAGTVGAAGYRMLADSKFILWQKHERLIVESMKISNASVAADESRIEAVYKDLYERIVSYFEINKPYLNSDLTINSIVKVMYSNKLYISRAISQYTGRNFCQFVNYYRVVHSMDRFRSNPDLKIHELANLSGFNSIVSYNMAFRLFMGENPSEWCRKERGKILKSLKK